MNFQQPCRFSLVIFIFLCACAPTTTKQFLAEGKIPLSEKQLHELIENYGLHLEAIDLDAKVQYLPNGRLKATSLQGTDEKGKWAITKEDRFCMKFDSWYFGDLRCYQLFAENDFYVFFTTNGARSYTATTFPINAHQDIKALSTYEDNSQHFKTQTVPKRTVAQKAKSLASLARNCPGCNFSGAELPNAQLIKANLPGTNFSGANLSGANLRRANLVGADLAGANLKKINLAGADLTNCNLSNADLTNSNLIHANITGAQLDGAVLTGAHLEGIKGLNK